MDKEEFQKIINSSKSFSLKKYMAELKKTEQTEIIKISRQKGISQEEAEKLFYQQKQEEIDRRRKEFKQEEISIVSRKRGISEEEAEKLIKEEKELDEKLKTIIIDKALIFEYNRNLILEYIDPKTLEGKKRIRWIIKQSLGRINNTYRDVFRLINKSKGIKQSKKLYKIYVETKNKVWELRYRNENYYQLISMIFETYLNKCFVVFFEFLIIDDRKYKLTNKAYSKEEILQSIMASPLLNEFFEQIEKIQSELEAEFEEKFETKVDSDNKRTSSETLDYERIIMQALENGEGDLFGF